uniref:EF-hand domain-containing protein n=1 Tax=Arion vulgaris TaxID=1028688 RepID=A0A0B7B732_9EUPU
MTFRIPASLILLVLIVMVEGWTLGYGHPLETAVDDARLQQTEASSTKLYRQVRSFPDNTPCLTIPYLTDLKRQFVRSLDHNNDGRATFDEVKDYMRRFKSNVNDQRVEAFIHRRDTNGNGAIDFVPEYVHDMTVSDYTMGGATEWFHLQDTNDDGFVSENELMNTTQALGVSPEEALNAVQGYYMAADLDKDEKLSFDEFKTLYNQ